MNEPASSSRPRLELQPEMQNTPVHLERPDRTWPERFAAEAAVIKGVLGDQAVAIEHVGSTSVQGIYAKPIIDIAVAVVSFDEVPKCVEPLGRIGYEYVPEFESTLPNRRYFRKDSPEGIRTHHVHMYEKGHVEFVEYLLFREYLRRHADAARDYERLKQDLAARLGRRDYTAAKAPFIRSVIDRARAEGLL